MPTEAAPLTGVAALADRAVDGRRAAAVMALVALLFAAGLLAFVRIALDGANDPIPDAGRFLGTLAPPPSRARTAPRRVAIVLVDGLRLDEAAAMRSWQRLAPSSIHGAVALPTPTLSRPFYHLLFTGVPPRVSGVRTNGFVEHARFDSLADRVREHGGSVLFVADGLEWMPRMHATPLDLVHTAPGSLGVPLDETLRSFRARPPPALLVVHAVTVDRTAHKGGIHSAAHRRAIREADAVVDRVARGIGEDAILVVTSDHGHIAAGGHGGPEPEVARAPFVLGVRGDPLTGDVDAVRLAPSLAAWLGVGPPRASFGAIDARIAPAGAHDDAIRRSRLVRLVAHGERVVAARLAARRTHSFAFGLVLLVMTLGPIKRAFGLDRGAALAIALVPSVAFVLHEATGRPWSLSAVDEQTPHALRVLAIGAGAALAAFVAGFFVAHGPRIVRARRIAASVGWSALAGAVSCSAWAGFALAPWPLSPVELYLPLFACGAGAGALGAAALGLASTLKSR